MISKIHPFMLGQTMFVILFASFWSLSAIDMPRPWLSLPLKLAGDIKQLYLLEEKKECSHILAKKQEFYMLHH
jgi:hypothetical protein